ncbi:hypothetical protein AAG906_028720 [Vitis piasezkii]
MRIARYLTKVRDTLQRFTEWTIEKLNESKMGTRRLGKHSASSPSKKSYCCLYMCKPTLRHEAFTCNTIEAKQANSQEWINDILGYLRTGTRLRIPSEHTRSGCKPPVSP